MRILIMYSRDKAENKNLIYLKSGSPVNESPEFINILKYARTRPRKRLNTRVYD
jgi:hypothetical protein